MRYAHRLMLVSYGWLLVSSLGLSSPSCVVEVRGIPPSMIGYHRLRAGTGEAWRAEPSLLIPRPSVSTWLTLEGPRFEGSRALEPGDCDPGPVIVKARPRPARVQFTGAPVNAVVECDGCPDERGVVMVDAFAPVPMCGLRLHIDLTLKARNHKTRRVRVVLFPGDNRVDARLERLR